MLLPLVCLCNSTSVIHARVPSHGCKTLNKSKSEYQTCVITSSDSKGLIKKPRQGKVSGKQLTVIIHYLHPHSSLNLQNFRKMKCSKVIYDINNKFIIRTLKLFYQAVFKSSPSYSAVSFISHS